MSIYARNDNKKPSQCVLTKEDKENVGKIVARLMIKVIINQNAQGDFIGRKRTGRTFVDISESHLNIDISHKANTTG